MRYHPDIRAALAVADPLAVDVGYGASHTTTVEWAGWLRHIAPQIQVVGLEINPERILPPRDGVSFELGGFELAGYEPNLVRAFNVLRQYDVAQVDEAWAEVCSHLAPGGLFVEGTCDELGRRSCWVLLDKDGPRSLTLAWDPFDVAQPSDLAERLPKKLIHRNTPGTAIYDFLQALDSAWERSAGWATYGPRVRWREARELLKGEFPFTPIRRRIRDNIITVPWQVVAN